jgi:predicted nucleic acid-binding Zn ribbon protein
LGGNVATFSLTCLACGEEIDITRLVDALDDDAIVCPSCDGRPQDLAGVGGSAGHEAA